MEKLMFRRRTERVARLLSLHRQHVHRMALAAGTAAGKHVGRVAVARCAELNAKASGSERRVLHAFLTRCSSSSAGPPSASCVACRNTSFDSVSRLPPGRAFAYSSVTPGRKTRRSWLALPPISAFGARAAAEPAQPGWLWSGVHEPIKNTKVR